MLFNISSDLDTFFELAIYPECVATILSGDIHDIKNLIDRNYSLNRCGFALQHHPQ